MVDIYNEIELREIMKAQIIYPLAEYLSQKIVELVREYILGMSEISTRTLRECVTYTVHKKKDGCTAAIYVNDRVMQEKQ